MAEVTVPVLIAKAEEALERQDLEAATTAYERALQLGPEGLLSSAILQELASIQRLKNQPTRALEYAKRAERIAANYGITRELAAVRLTIGNALADLHEYEGARVAISEAAKLFNDLKLPLEQAQALVGLARIYGELNDSKRARQLLSELLASQPTDRLRSQILNNLAIFAMQDGDVDEARRLLSEDLAVCRKLNDKYGQMVTSINMGRLVEGAGHRDEAIEWFEQARQLAIDIRNIEIEKLVSERLGSLRASGRE